MSTVIERITRLCPAETVKSTFKPNEKNRVIHPVERNNHILRLGKSIAENGFSPNHPIIVNSKMVIQSGHHRYHAAVIAKSPIYYIVDDNYSFEDNTHMDDIAKRWSTTDWISYYANNGNTNYIQIQQFIKRFPNIGIKVVQAILEDKTNEQSSDAISTFKSGNFKLNVPLSTACLNAMRIEEAWNLIPMENRTRSCSNCNQVNQMFALAMLALFKETNYKHEQLLQKLGEYAYDFTVGPNRRTNLMKLVEIYNKRIRKDGKITKIKVAI